MTKKDRYKKVIEWFQKEMPIAETELVFETDFQLVVAVVLSAQCTDKRVNIITPELFAKYPNAESMAKAEKSEIFEYIKSCTYPNSKAGYLKGLSEMIVRDFDGNIPDDLIDLQKLPGVGRKTANVVLSVVFKVPAMPVDTHVFRVSERIGLTYRAKTPMQTETQLVSNIPKELLSVAHHWLILHGRYVCLARNPKCSKCGLRPFCKYYAKNVRN
jgi:endonuclease-3